MKAFENRAKEKSTPSTSTARKAGVRRFRPSRVIGRGFLGPETSGVFGFSTPARMSIRQSAPGINASQKIVRKASSVRVKRSAAAMAGPTKAPAASSDWR